jgi:myo-inositol-1(or 4)-monophosphatase
MISKEHRYHYELTIAIEAARKAAMIIKDFDQNRGQLGIHHKEKYDLVTDADIASEKCIRDIIHHNFPKDAFLGEEGRDPEFVDGRRWIVDPIDGTTNFAHSFPPYCVSIALYDGIDPILGLVLEVSRDELFYAVKGEGAFCNDRSITVSPTTVIDRTLIGTGFPVEDGVNYDKMLNIVRTILKETQGLRRTGSAAYDLACVAAGRLDGFFETGLKPWDVAAAALIVKEAGGIVTDFSGGDSWLHSRKIIAGTTLAQPYLEALIVNAGSDLH